MIMAPLHAAACLLALAPLALGFHVPGKLLVDMPVRQYDAC